MAEKNKAADGTEVKSPKMVTVRLFKDSGKYTAPRFVGVNGKHYLIERGKDVEVPDYVAEVLKNSEDQMLVAEAAMAAAEKGSEG